MTPVIHIMEADDRANNTQKGLSINSPDYIQTTRTQMMLDIILVSFPVSGIKCSDRDHLREKGLLAQSSSHGSSWLGKAGV